MMHSHRVWSPCTRSVEEAARMLKENDWVLCNAFRIEGKTFDIYLLNDSITENSIQEYAVVCVSREHVPPEEWLDYTIKADAPPGQVEPTLTGRTLAGVQIESLTVDWCTEDRLILHLSNYLAGEQFLSQSVIFDIHSATMRCELCA